MLSVNKAATVPTTVETEGPMTQPKHLSGVRALDVEGLSLFIGYDTIVEHGQGIAEMHASCHNGIEGKKYHDRLNAGEGDPH